MDGHQARGNIQWPNHLTTYIPPFANWLLNVVKMQTTNGVEVDLDVLRFSRPQNRIAYIYKNMWVYINHYRVDENEGCMAHATYDSGVACIFSQGSWCSARDQNIIVANMHYVGVLKEIIVVSYGGLRLVVMKCLWIHVNNRGNAIMKQDEYGF
jgi:hypothetical protein